LTLPKEAFERVDQVEDSADGVEGRAGVVNLPGASLGALPVRLGLGDHGFALANPGGARTGLRRCWATRQLDRWWEACELP
jgi:hypothetical protein